MKPNSRNSRDAQSKKLIAKKCAKAHDKKKCAMRVFKGLMKFPCFKAIATKCKKDKACWKAARPALMKCKKAVTRRMIKKWVAKFAKKQCGRHAQDVQEEHV